MITIPRQRISIMWFRNDLRLDSNPAFRAACESGVPVLCLYINADERSEYAMGGASKWWLDKSLKALNRQLEKVGGSVCLKRTKSNSVIHLFEELKDTFDIQAVFWNRRYDVASRKSDESIKTWLKDCQIEVNSFNGNLLREPWQIKTQDGRPYRVFTPFWKTLKSEYSRTQPSGHQACEFATAKSDELADWNLHPTGPDWSSGLKEAWIPGEEAAQDQLFRFLENDLKGYHSNRDRPDMNGTSRLSPYLAFGEISPQQIWSSTLAAMEASSELESDGWAFLREVGWRDFAYHLLFQSSDLANENWNTRFDKFPWQSSEDRLTAWQSGQTGYPVVDAGMRQLWHTGWMHNRVRMIVASFLVKHLLIDWREGEKWFWDTLVDADPANNPASWQWVAGSGADAAPYFRIFNPMTQGQKFDPDGEYVRKWVPELRNLPVKYIHQPWTAPALLLEHAGIKLGKTYPKPIVDHADARQSALDAYELTK